jgi:hypothetical protein
MELPGWNASLATVPGSSDVKSILSDCPPFVTGIGRRFVALPEFIGGILLLTTINPSLFMRNTGLYG